MNTTAHIRKANRGFSIVEVLVAVVIFVLAIVAFGLLQGNLTRNSLDARLRTVAVNMGEEAIESRRRFSRIATDPDGLVFAYEDIQTSSWPVTRGGVDFTIDQTVTDYYWDPASGQFTTSAPAGRVHSDFKRVELDVSWANPLEFNIQEGVDTSGHLGSGGISLTGIISSAVTATNRLAILDDLNGESFQPPVGYDPGALPDVVTLSLGANRFKESTTPIPEVIRSDELVETEFDVITYSTSDSGATFVRREEFKVVSCECTLRQPPLDAVAGGRRPTVWTGVEYAAGEPVAKAWGEPANSQQSELCDLCCRDHHDGGSGAGDDPDDPGRSLYGPFRSASEYHADGTFSGDHKHYGRDPQGQLVLALADGDRYLEACRLVRKDGFFKVAQDLRLEGLNAFPGDFLDQSSEELEYSTYVTTALTTWLTGVGDGYEGSPPVLPAPGEVTPPVVFPATTSLAPTYLPTATGATTQQLRSRGVYVDYLSDELRTLVSCLDGFGDGPSCGAPEASSALEVLPFYDLQLTWLSRWNEAPTNIPVEVSNQAVATDNTHSRGLAERTTGSGLSAVDSAGHEGNLGLTATDPIDPDYASELRSARLYVAALNSTPLPTPGSIQVTGQILSGVAGVRAADVEIEWSESQCDRTSTGYACVVDALANNPRLTVSNYEKRHRVLVACSSLVTQVVNTGANPFATFDLPTTGSTTQVADIVIREDGCD